MTSFFLCVQYSYVIKMCMSPGRASLQTFILFANCAVKSLVTVEYQHAVISSNVALLLEELEILQMAHIIVFYQRLLICTYFNFFQAFMPAITCAMFPPLL